MMNEWWWVPSRFVAHTIWSAGMMPLWPVSSHIASMEPSALKFVGRTLISGIRLHRNCAAGRAQQNGRIALCETRHAALHATTIQPRVRRADRRERGTAPRGRHGLIVARSAEVERRRDRFRLVWQDEVDRR